MRSVLSWWLIIGVGGDDQKGAMRLHGTERSEVTTLVIKDGVIAADTKVSCGGSHFGEITKIAMSPDGWWVGASGESGHPMILLDFVRETKMGKRIKKMPEVDWDKVSVIAMNPEGGMYMIENSFIVVPVRGKYVADGSGGAFAQAAMEAGANAVEAARIAMRLDNGSGGEIEWAEAGKPDIHRA